MGQEVMAILTITRVDTLDNQTLDIELSNGSLILFNLRPLLDEDPAYACLRAEALLPRPRTDGKSIFWPGGPRLALGEIMTLLNRQGSI